MKPRFVLVYIHDWHGRKMIWMWNLEIGGKCSTSITLDQLHITLALLTEVQCILLYGIRKCNAYSIQLFTQLLKSGTVSQTMLLEQFLIWGSSLLKAVCIGFFWKLVNHNLSVSSSPIYNNNFTELQWTICLAFWILGVLVGYCSHNACYIQKITYWRTKLPKYIS